MLNFSTKNQQFREIMANGLRYYVPKFQRDYAWTYEHWEDLWEDLEITPDEDQHYMGYLVFQSKTSKEFAVIDGQQRLTTVSIIIIAALYNLKDIIEKGIDAEKNQQRLEQIRNSYIGFTDNVTLVSSPKLTLNINNADYYRSYICPLDDLPVRNVTKSERQLQKAVSYFRTKITEKVGNDDGTAIASFIEGMVDKFLFTTITVGSDLNAYRVFETLNARGVQLSVPDLLKNYLFSLIDQGKTIDNQELIELENRWQQILKQLGQIDFTKFVLAHWNSFKPSVNRSQLFRKLKSEITDRRSAFDYINQLRSDSQIYAALHDSNDEFWANETMSAAREPLRALNMFNVSQPFSMLLAAYRKLDEIKFCKLLKSIEAISVRYNVIGSRQANTQDKVYNSTSQKISSGTFKNIQSIKDGLKDIYISDDDFHSDFTKKSMKTAQSNKKVRYILARLEETKNGNKVSDLDYTLEHVLPDTPNGVWITEFGKQYDAYIDRLGNMSLLTVDENKKAKRLPFENKKEIYADSKIELTSNITDWDEWNADSVETRQTQLADIAIKCWSVEFS